MSKDQAIGGATLGICVVAAVGYLVLVGVPSFLGLAITNTRLDAVLILVSIAFVLILAIGGWIGYTMAMTQPPKPIKATENEEKKEEPNQKDALDNPKK